MKFAKYDVAMLLILSLFSSSALSQTPSTDVTAHTQNIESATHARDTPANQNLVTQVAEMRAKLKQLENSIEMGKMPDDQSESQMDLKQSPNGMVSMQGVNRGMASMQAGNRGMAGMQVGSGGMEMMGKMGMMRMMGGTMQGKSVNSALPGFPGASHLYHIGADGFFLSQSEYIVLTIDQQKTLAQVQQAALLEQAEFQRKIEQSEQDLWVMTAAESPDVDSIKAKIGEIATLESEQRLAFIRAVGRAAEHLTEVQRMQLTGLLPPAAMSSSTMTSIPD